MAKNKISGSGINPNRFHISQLKFFFILLPALVFMLLPIIFIFSNAFKPVDELFAYPPRFLVRKPTLNNFLRLFNTSVTSNIPVERYLFNSVVVTVVIIVLSIIIATFAGYVFSKKKFKGKAILFKINTLALMFVPTAVSIPRYLIIEEMHLIDTFSVHILPALAMPVGLFLIKQVIDDIPDSLIEAAQIDGAGDLYILKGIIFPLVMPAIATISILAFQVTWNSAETSSMYINNEAIKTFAYYMSVLVSGAGGNPIAGQGMSAAAGLIMFVPNLILFVALQSRVMDTMVHSGIK